MKTNNPDEESAVLSGLLHGWSVKSPLPPRFRDDVWGQIALKEKPAFSLGDSLSRWLEGVLPRPKIALFYVTALLVIGMATGLWTARAESNRINAALGSRYVQSVDPYQAAH